MNQLSLMLQTNASRSDAPIVGCYGRVFSHVSAANGISVVSLGGTMLNLFKRDPKKALHKQYLALMKEARDLQRAGKIPELARKTAEADAVLKQLEALEAAEAAS
jgi:hypothetical protein